MKGFYENEVRCQVCKKEYKITKLLSRKAVVKKRDSDFCPHYKDLNPIFYSVNVCPHCGFTSFNSDEEKLNSQEIKKYKEKMSSKWKYQELNGIREIDDAIKIYKLLLLTYNVIDEKKSSIATACLRLAWLYRYKNDKENEMKYLKNMIKNNEIAFSTEKLSVNYKNELEIMFIVGETYRKLGEFKEAVKWFTKVNAHEDINKHRIIKIRNKDQWSLAMEEYRNGDKNE